MSISEEPTVRNPELKKMSREDIYFQKIQKMVEINVLSKADNQLK